MPARPAAAAKPCFSAAEMRIWRVSVFAIARL
jgi:hypothetical protein